MTDKVILFSRKNRTTRGGVELFNENLLSLLGENALHVAETSKKQHLVISYAYRLFHTIQLFRNNARSTIIVQYGSFIDILAIIILRFFCGKIYAIAHVSDTWKHLATRTRRRMCAKVLNFCLVKLLILAESQRSIFAGVEVEKIRTIIHPAYAEDCTLEESRDFFLYVGRITAEKGVLDIIDAWERLGVSAPKLVVAGSGEEGFLNEFINRIDRFQPHGLVSYIGSITNPYELRKFYRKATAVIYPSYSDAFPLVMLESISQNTPIIITRVGEVAHFLYDYDYFVRAGNVDDIIKVVLHVDGNPVDTNKISVYSEIARSFAHGAIIDDFVRLGILQNDS